MNLVGEKDVECDDIIITEISAQEPCLDSQSSWVICEQSNERDLWDLSHSEAKDFLKKVEIQDTMASLCHILMGRNGDYFLNYIDYLKNLDVVLKLLLVI